MTTLADPPNNKLVVSDTSHSLLFALDKHTHTDKLFWQMIFFSRLYSECFLTAVTVLSLNPYTWEAEGAPPSLLDEEM